MTARMDSWEPTGVVPLNTFARKFVKGYPASRCSDLAALKRLEDDLRSGRWQQLYGDVLAKEDLDIGYRLSVGSVPRLAATT